MKTSVGRLRKIVQETMVDEGGRIGAHPDYMKKERVRQILQDAVVQAVAQGGITSEEELEHFFQTAPIAFNALRMVPLSVYQKLASNG
jgi:hypothetical protein